MESDPVGWLPVSEFGQKNQSNIPLAPSLINEKTNADYRLYVFDNPAFNRGLRTTIVRTRLFGRADKIRERI